MDDDCRRLPEGSTNDSGGPGCGTTVANRVWQGSYWLMMGTLVGCGFGSTGPVTKLHPPQPDDRKITIQSATSQKLISSAPQRRHGEAQYNLGRAYEKGFGVKKDLAEAANWYQRAAEQGHSDAQNSLGLLLVAEQRDYARCCAMVRPWQPAKEMPTHSIIWVLIYYSGLGVNYRIIRRSIGSKNGRATRPCPGPKRSWQNV
jgi:TPR repeat protein